MGGEILGVAGIAGSGQKELLEAIAGLHPVAEPARPSVYTPEATAPERELVGKTPMQIKQVGRRPRLRPGGPARHGPGRLAWA